jgi:hypothetical protein
MELSLAERLTSVAVTVWGVAAGVAVFLVETVVWLEMEPDVYLNPHHLPLTCCHLASQKETRIQMDGVLHLLSRRCFSRVFVYGQLEDPVVPHLQIYRRCLQILAFSLPPHLLCSVPETLYECHFLWTNLLANSLVHYLRLQT